MTKGEISPTAAQAVDEESVVLVDDENRVLGTMPKALVHGVQTPLHRAFSSYVFRASDKRLLLQQRSAAKHTWPLVWSNSCCGHPALGESNVDAARRRLRFELGLDPTILEEVAPYRYCFARDGVMENEICPILVGLVDSEPVLNRAEVEAVRWIDWDEFARATEDRASGFSDWSIEQVRVLERTPRFREIVGL
jgi:isopentenyl-diphosphate delta-isomerase